MEPKVFPALSWPTCCDALQTIFPSVVRRIRIEVSLSRRMVNLTHEHLVFDWAAMGLTASSTALEVPALAGAWSNLVNLGHRWCYWCWCGVCLSLLSRKTQFQSKTPRAPVLALRLQ